MEERGNGFRTRNTERLFILLTGMILLVLFFRLSDRLQQRNQHVSAGLENGTIVNLNGPAPAGALERLLAGGYYLQEERDRRLVAKVVQEQADRGFHYQTIGELNKRQFYLPAAAAAAEGGSYFKKRAEMSRALLGFSGADENRYAAELNHPPALPAARSAGKGSGTISGRITGPAGAVPGVLVRLSTVLPADSVSAAAFSLYLRTGKDGGYHFKGLPEEKSYEVIPMRPGYEYGQVKGTEKLKGHQELNFSQQEHTIRLLASREFNLLKNEGALIVRTPEAFQRTYWLVTGTFLLVFILLHLLLSWRYPAADQLLLPLVMLLTGFSFLTLFSLQDPLRDRLLAADAVRFLCLGAVLCGGICLLNIRRFTPDSSFYRLFVFRSGHAANGWPWIALAAVLLAGTLLFGAGPEGSGVKVNLLGVQPSEVVKYLTVLFLAGFFALNEQFISGYSGWKKRWPFFYFALAAIGCTLLLFLLLGDLGPAMVICFTFIILFSFSRGDFSEMTAAVLLLVVLCWLISTVWIALVLVFGLLLLYLRVKKKSISESAVMALLVITAFLTIDQIPGLEKLAPGPVQRLTDRKAIWQDPWNNEVYGGDQVANGLWAISGGGLSGQGTGEGYAKTIPEAHTDMILPAIGEEFGWAGISCLFLLYLVYLHRALLIGRQTGTPFLFYCCAGIGICTFVQFLLIAGGSTGALPLSGVSLPFESYGGSSLVINFTAAGFLLAASGVQGTKLQLGYLSKQQDKNLVPALLAACAAIVLLIINVSKYSLHSAAWMVRPALVADKGGSRMFSYNPRIAVLMKKLDAGNVYDRNGLILATSDPELVRRQQDRIRQAGIARYDLDAAQHKRLSRFYPFAEQLFFWTGDANTGVFSGGLNGYFAEYTHAAELRGFKTPVRSYTLTASRYREDRFLPRSSREMTVLEKDYSAIVPLLRSGLDSLEIAAFKKRNRDIRLSIDASLQTQLQQSLSADPGLHNNRVSVVVLSAKSGDVLASAAYPLPPVENWEQLTMSTAEQHRLAGWLTTADPGFTIATQPGSTAKLLTAMAAFNKLGTAAAGQTYLVRPAERIRSSGPEPDETGQINMERAIVKSNNVYFIKLANEQQLQDQMADLYMKTGMFLHGAGGYYFTRGTVSEAQEQRWMDLWKKTEFSARYDRSNIYRTRAAGISGMAWGQGELIATPAAVARLAAGIANEGGMVPGRYVLKLNDSTVHALPGVKLAEKPAYAALLRQYMIEQSAGKAGEFGLAVAGKTGTPERMVRKKKVNDGWYVFFAPNAGGEDMTVVCIRIEATRGSSDAVKLAASKVIPVLVSKGYMKSIR